MSIKKGNVQSVLLYVSAFLFVLALIYLIHGIPLLFTQSGDFKLRWTEEHYVFQGKNPLDVFQRYHGFYIDQPAVTKDRDDKIDPKLGPTQAGYPPWAYVTGLVFTWMPYFPYARIYFGMINILFLMYMFAWALNYGKKRHLYIGLFLASSLLAVHSIYTSFIVGQYCVFVFSALIAAYIYDQKGRPFASGLFLGLAMTKVTLTGPFLLPFLIKGRWKALFVAGSYIIIASLIIWPIVKTNPLEMLQQMVVSSAINNQSQGNSLIDLLAWIGISSAIATKWAALISISIALVLLYLWRFSTMLTLYAIAALAARAWSYHRGYDNMIIIFILIELGATAWDSQNLLGFVSYFLVGVSLWVPDHPLELFTSWILLQWLLWIQGLAMLLFLRSSFSENSVKNKLFSRKKAFLTNFQFQPD